MVTVNEHTRQLRVAQLHLRGLTPGEVALALAQAGVPATIDIVCRDIELLEQVWAMDVRGSARHKGRVLAEIREMRRAAWAAGDFEAVLKSLKQEADLLRLGSV